MIRNLISSFLTKSLVALAMLLILLVSTKQLGSEIVGEISLLVLSLAIIQTINDIYTGPALVYFIPKYGLKRIYFNGLIWTFACIIILNLVFFIFNIGIKALWLHVLVLSLISTLQAFHNVILLARERIKTYNFLVLFQPLLLLAVLCFNIFILDIKTINASIIAMYFSWVAGLTISAGRVAKIINKEKEIKEELPTLAILKNGLVNQLGNLAHTLSNRFNYFMLEKISLLMVGVYASATSLIESVWVISGSASPIILTYIANKTHEPENNSRVTMLLSKLCFLLSLFCVLLIVVIPADLFTLLLGKDFSSAKTIMLYLSPGVLCISFSSIISHYFSGLGKQKILLVANCCGLAVTIFTSYFFISSYGILGACYAASLSYVVQALVLVTVFIRQNRLGLSELFDFRIDAAILRKK